MFTKLPTEIRDKIYGFIEDLEPCYIFPCRYNTGTSGKRIRVMRIHSYKPPIVLHLYRESRNEFLVRGGANTTIHQTYTLVKRMTSLSKPVYVRLNRDNLFLQELEALSCMAIYTMRHITVAIPFDQIGPKFLALQLRRFNLLESLTLVLALKKRDAETKEMDLIRGKVEAELQATQERFPEWTAQPVVKTVIVTFGLQDQILSSNMSSSPVLSSITNGPSLDSKKAEPSLSLATTMAAASTPYGNHASAFNSNTSFLGAGIATSISPALSISPIGSKPDFKKTLPLLSPSAPVAAASTFHGHNPSAFAPSAIYFGAAAFSPSYGNFKRDKTFTTVSQVLPVCLATTEAATAMIITPNSSNNAGILASQNLFVHYATSFSPFLDVQASEPLQGFRKCPPLLSLATTVDSDLPKSDIVTMAPRQAVLSTNITIGSLSAESPAGPPPTLDKFTPFPRLPLELRLMIFCLMEPSPGLIRKIPRLGKIQKYERVGGLRTIFGPAVLQICREARNELRGDKPALCSHAKYEIVETLSVQTGVTRFYMDKTVDTFYLHAESHMENSSLWDVQRIAFSSRTIDTAHINFAERLGRFKALKSITVMIPEFAFFLGDAPYTPDSDRNMTVLAREYPALESNIQKALSGMTTSAGEPLPELFLAAGDWPGIAIFTKAESEAYWAAIRLAEELKRQAAGEKGFWDEDGDSEMSWDSNLDADGDSDDEVF
ncbi:hypothetical protein MBM_02663 [Drepanopeziza brunnea f. sp. 'multigermtubi' MB_m1]|uniref:2EXR domain-containing protein n=1 Tax=Marssonina brunnea f. sp. multigermtubi (strain MB_m1) TaxID=1072389 RepID=K1X2G5_MARBU|nr:uncharacterized protein MBM_02663 [Drepanopeziza brunnea f. sp. 'multigermtubi' MB_m1]EKD19426.1 hypothetical protein MBM_02663 [Drepanopeziza brunnea f. sp. 'multigermtubi' MB_m1]